MKKYAENRKASFDYTFIDTLNAGVVLTGNEIKSVRQNKIQLSQSYVTIKNGEAYLENCHIDHYDHGSIWNVDELRRRKLLLHKKEIEKWYKSVSQEGLTIIPLYGYFVRGRFKLRIALAKGKKSYDKRESLKQRYIEKRLKQQKFN